MPTSWRHYQAGEGMERTKKAWHQPRLTVLVRGRRDERVLAGCKVDQGQGPTGGNSQCMGDGPQLCSSCYQMTGS